jgi:hypothetical protein
MIHSIDFKIMSIGINNRTKKILFIIIQNIYMNERYPPYRVGINYTIRVISYRKRKRELPQCLPGMVINTNGNIESGKTIGTIIKIFQS